MTTQKEIDALMAACQRGGTNVHALNNLLAKCYGTLGALSVKVQFLENSACEDTKRIDWLADKNQSIGNVQLPTRCVTANLHSLRGAIDMAMHLGARDESTSESPGHRPD